MRKRHTVIAIIGMGATMNASAENFTTEEALNNSPNTVKLEVVRSSTKEQLDGVLNGTNASIQEENSGEDDENQDQRLEGEGETNAERTQQYAKDLGISIDSRRNEYIGEKLIILDFDSYNFLVKSVQNCFEKMQDEEKSPFSMFVVENTYNIRKEKGGETENFEFEIENYYDKLHKYTDVCEKISQGVLHIIELEQQINESIKEGDELKKEGDELKKVGDELKKVGDELKKEGDELKKVGDELKKELVNLQKTHNQNVRNVYGDYTQGKETQQGIREKLQRIRNLSKERDQDYPDDKWKRDTDVLEIFKEMGIK